MLFALRKLGGPVYDQSKTTQCGCMKFINPLPIAISAVSGSFVCLLVTAITELFIQLLYLSPLRFYGLFGIPFFAIFIFSLGANACGYTLIGLIHALVSPPGNPTESTIVSGLIAAGLAWVIGGAILVAFINLHQTPTSTLHINDWMLALYVMFQFTFAGISLAKFFKL